MEAMKHALAQKGIKVVSVPIASAYTVLGSVELGSGWFGQQTITIRRVVIDPSGTQLEKKVVQNNKIVAGSLEGAWGLVAIQAATAAATELRKTPFRFF